MPQLDVYLDGEGAWPDIDPLTVVEGEWTRITILPRGMQSGNPSIGILVMLPDGRPCFAETSWRLLYSAVQAMAARWGPPA